MSKQLKDKQIEDLLSALEDGNISDDGLEDENDDDEDENFYSNAREVLNELIDDNEGDEDDPEITENRTEDADPPLVLDQNDVPDPPLVNDARQPSSSSVQVNSIYTNFDKRRLLWKRDNLLYNVNKTSFDLIPTDPGIADLDTPYRCFLHYFTPDFLQKIVEESNLYAVQTNPSTTFHLTSAELKKIIGILLYFLV